MILNEKTHLNDAACDQRNLLEIIIITYVCITYTCIILPEEEEILGFYG